MSIPKAVGIETEYGIMLWGADGSNPFLSSQMVLNAYQHVGGPAVPTGMYYSANTGEPQPEYGEAAHNPAAQTTPTAIIDPVYYGLGSLMLGNGARYYIDHAHPEYCTPETLTPRNVVAADKAGEYIVAQCVEAVNASESLPEGQKLVIYKNNSDYKGNSYGCHENYLLGVDLFEDLLRRRSHLIYRYLLPFQISRVIMVGAGKVGYENKTEPAAFQLSQRADFFEMLTGLQTTYRRPLFNQRDESHTDSRVFRRLHVILGDANLSELATYLKVGTMQLVLHMIEDGFIKDDLTLADPLAAFQQVSRDLTFQQPLLLESGQQMTAVEMQEVYLDLAEKYLEQGGGSDDDWHLWDLWVEVVEALQAGNWQAMANKLDWAIKRQVLDRYLTGQETTWETVRDWQAVIETVVRLNQPPAEAADLARSLAGRQGLRVEDYDRQREVYFGLRRLDLEYHDIRRAGPETGLFYRLQQGGLIERLLNDDEVLAMVNEPPPDTRAWLRGKIVGRFHRHIAGIDWGYVKLRGQEKNTVYRLEFPNPMAGTQEDMAEVWDSLQTPDEMFVHFHGGH